MATEAFLRVAHGLHVVPGDETEMASMSTVDSPPGSRARPSDLDARLREMDARAGHGGAQPQSARRPALPHRHAVPPARAFGDAETFTAVAAFSTRKDVSSHRETATTGPERRKQVRRTIPARRPELSKAFSSPAYAAGRARGAPAPFDGGP
ncbi:hypothetical protein [Microbispora sp. KK1-11]|uniref:hypothetical protein n=1 Tax=Microbispora sp. KK1-11 TaxID=2053005 RepID=UPI00163CC651|nr:hypothetical protein [Microbispora sp. KK1-11]